MNHVLNHAPAALQKFSAGQALSNFAKAFDPPFAFAKAYDSPFAFAKAFDPPFALNT